MVQRAPTETATGTPSPMASPPSTSPAPRSPATSPAASAATAGPETAPVEPNKALPDDIDELARRLYPRLRPYLRRELWHDRERAGLLTDLT